MPFSSNACKISLTDFSISGCRRYGIRCFGLASGFRTILWVVILVKPRSVSLIGNMCANSSMRPQNLSFQCCDNSGLSMLMTLRPTEGSCLCVWLPFFSVFDAWMSVGIPLLVSISLFQSVKWPIGNFLRSVTGSDVGLKMRTGICLSCAATAALATNIPKDFDVLFWVTSPRIRWLVL